MENHGLEKEKGHQRLKSYFFWKTVAIIPKPRLGSDHRCLMKEIAWFTGDTTYPHIAFEQRTEHSLTGFQDCTLIARNLCWKTLGRPQERCWPATASLEIEIRT